MTKIHSRSLKDVYPHIYDFFKLGFYSTAINRNESILFDMPNVWTIDNLQTILKNFDKEELAKMRESEDSNDKDLFWKRLKDQFSDVASDIKPQIYCLLADLTSLHYVFTAGSGSKVMQEAICTKLPVEVFGLDHAIEIDFTITDTWSRANGGMYYNQQRPHGICYYALLALDALEEPDKTISLLNALFSNGRREEIDSTDFAIRLDTLSSESLIKGRNEFTKALKNMLEQRTPHHFALLHAAAPEVFLPILSQADINQINKTFGGLIDDTEPEQISSDVEQLRINGKISSKLTELTGYSTLNDQPGVDNFANGGHHIAFYDSRIKPLWHDGTKSSEDKFGLSAALRIKKQIILYGPPGTGKTFSAKELAQSFIFAAEVKKHGFKKTLGSKSDEDVLERLMKARSTEIQIHPNMGYEDFIGGLTLDSENGGTVSKYQKGLFWQTMEEASKFSVDEPYFVILDEINRTDLSRMMGECLSRLEYRDAPISVPNAPKNENQFIIPDNVYIIGTMNEIDHSLERIDFAMRRRFIWIESGFNSNSLREILALSAAENSQKAEFQTPNETIDDLVYRAIRLNKEIEKQNTLGKKYQVGHSYFLDINNRNICKVNKKGEITDTEYKKGLKLLWSFSIKPILESYEPGENSSYMSNFETAFLG